MNTYLDDCVFVKNLSGVISPTFRGKPSDDILAIYQIDNSFNLEKDSSDEEIVKNLSLYMDCNPDGWLIFVPSHYDIKAMIEKEYLKAYEDGKLNFDNGELAETIIFHKLNSGLLIEFFDPECGSDFLNELAGKIDEIVEEGLLSYELSHMPSHVSELDQEFLDVLESNSIEYQKN